MKPVTIQRFTPDFQKIYVFDAPASKSLINRALILAAFSDGDTLLRCGSFAEDTRAVLNCLSSLGITTEKRPDGIHVYGCGENVPNKQARLNVMSAGTCARFFPAVLSALGGDYFFDASEQMKNRPMEFLSELEKAGAQIEFYEKENSFPFRLRSEGFISKEFTAYTDTSTQYASALLLAGALSKEPLSLTLTGSRTEGSYIKMTLSLLSAFGAEWSRNKNTVTVHSSTKPPKAFDVEADLSAACYFYALALLFGIKVLVRRVKKNGFQGDIKFLGLLEKRGVKFSETNEGLLADGSGIDSFEGFTENFCDFSDQTLTAAALAPFASSLSRITGIGHIRRQECDRITAIEHNLNALGVHAVGGNDFIEIQPTLPGGGTVKTFHDHRVAMAFSLIGLKTGNLVIDDAECSDKTFEGYFKELNKLHV